MRDMLEGFTERFDLLDHGFLRVVDVMPRLVEDGETADHAVARAARVSYQTGTSGKRTDRGLIRYLLRHWHTSPFEMVDIKIHVKMPIFVARQWVRHRTASINEVSARYSVLPEEIHLPALEHIARQSRDNKQGREQEPVEPELGLRIRERMQAAGHEAFSAYHAFLDDGIARETARGVLPVNTFTEWYWKANLLNVLRFLQLRLDPHAQYEIRVYAEALAQVVAHVAPWTWEAFQEYWMSGRRLSAVEWGAIEAVLTDDQRRAVVASLRATQSAGELREFSAWFAPDVDPDA